MFNQCVNMAGNKLSGNLKRSSNLLFGQLVCFMCEYVVVCTNLCFKVTAQHVLFILRGPVFLHVFLECGFVCPCVVRTENVR